MVHKVFFGRLPKGIKKEEFEIHVRNNDIRTYSAVYFKEQYAFLEFSDLSEAQACINKMDRTDFMGQKIVVELARNNNEKNKTNKTGSNHNSNRQPNDLLKRASFVQDALRLGHSRPAPVGDYDYSRRHPNYRGEPLSPLNPFYDSYRRSDNSYFDEDRYLRSSSRLPLDYDTISRYDHRIPSPHDSYRNGGFENSRYISDVSRHHDTSDLRQYSLRNRSPLPYDSPIYSSRKRLSPRERDYLRMSRDSRHSLYDPPLDQYSRRRLDYRSPPYGIVDDYDFSRDRYRDYIDDRIGIHDRIDSRSSFIKRDSFRKVSPTSRREPLSNRLDKNYMNTRVYIKNIPYQVTWKELKEYFGSIARIKYLECHNQTPGEGRADFETEEDAKLLIAKLSDTEYKGRTLRLTYGLNYKGPTKKKKTEDSEATVTVAKE